MSLERNECGSRKGNCKGDIKNCHELKRLVNEAAGTANLRTRQRKRSTDIDSTLDDDGEDVSHGTPARALRLLQ